MLQRSNAMRRDAIAFSIGHLWHRFSVGLITFACLGWPVTKIPDGGRTLFIEDFTLGADGAYYHHRDGTPFTVPAFDIEVRCMCGCGDAFDAGFAVALCRGMDPETSVRFAQATSALNATGLGSQAGVEDFEHSWAFMQQTRTKPSHFSFAMHEQTY